MVIFLYLFKPVLKWRQCSWLCSEAKNSSNTKTKKSSELLKGEQTTIPAYSTVWQLRQVQVTAFDMWHVCHKLTVIMSVVMTVVIILHYLESEKQHQWIILIWIICSSNIKLLRRETDWNPIILWFKNPSLISNRRSPLLLVVASLHVKKCFVLRIQVECVVPENIHTPPPPTEGIGKTREDGGLKNIKKYMKPNWNFQRVGGIGQILSVGGMNNFLNYTSMWKKIGRRGNALLCSLNLHSFLVNNFPNQHLSNLNLGARLCKSRLRLTQD